MRTARTAGEAHVAVGEDGAVGHGGDGGGFRAKDVTEVCTLCHGVRRPRIRPHVAALHVHECPREHDGRAAGAAVHAQRVAALEAEQDHPNPHRHLEARQRRKVQHTAQAAAAQLLGAVPVAAAAAAGVACACCGRARVGGRSQPVVVQLLKASGYLPYSFVQ